MKKFITSTAILFSFIINSYAQTVTIYRSGIATSPTYSTVAAAAAAALNGDSVVLSAHTFYEHNLLLPTGTVWKGTQTATDSSIIDAEKKGGCATPFTKAGLKRNLVLRDIIFTRGEGGGLGPAPGVDSLKLKGYSIVRNCHSPKNGGAVYKAFLYDHAKLTHNVADSFGGGGCFVFAFDSAEICYNTAPYGGGVGYEGAGGAFWCSSPGVRIHHNTATIGGGGLYGAPQMDAGQITNNQAPLGAAIHTVGCGSAHMQNCYVYNPRLVGTRQNEVYVRSGYFNVDGSWFGQSDTVGLISVNPLGCAGASARIGKPAKANWSINRGKPITNKDTLFPIGAAFTYIDGSALPLNSLPWLRGKFSSSTGTMLTPSPKVSPMDTMSSLFRTYVYAVKNDTTSKPISFVCIVDADTFRTSPRVWGRDSIKLSIGTTRTINVLVYPNPASDYLHIDGAEIGSSIDLYDVFGKLLLHETVTNSVATLNIQALPVGTYLLNIITKEGEKGTAKLLKE